MKRMALAILMISSVGCATDPATPGGGDDGAGDGGDDSQVAPSFTVTDPTDADGDGLPEQLEDYLMQTFGPELRLAPDDIDWTRPANVDWYLPKVRMRFDHPNCPDDSSNLLDAGKITFASIHAQTHFTKSTLCIHNSGAADQRFSNKKHLEF